ncbi:hypothetical protein Nepgr_013510 [Nepenthes gracilis]|uniref:Uncharacterized protein n=1 Tax=Nepenthes gracilis TaxID=150966 RepID=A0AAD3XP78_NEPGR|nr:hypothetical protein Nepgr_013510 [Nepenthes gracilis]
MWIIGTLVAFYEILFTAPSEGYWVGLLVSIFCSLLKYPLAGGGVIYDSDVVVAAFQCFVLASPSYTWQSLVGIVFCCYCELVWETVCSAEAVVGSWLFWSLLRLCHESLAASLLICRAGAIAMSQTDGGPELMHCYWFLNLYVCLVRMLQWAIYYNEFRGLFVALSPGYVFLDPGLNADDAVIQNCSMVSTLCPVWQWMFWEVLLSVLVLRYPNAGVAMSLCNSDLTTTAPDISLVSIFQWGLLLVVIFDYGLGELSALLCISSKTSRVHRGELKQSDLQPQLIQHSGHVKSEQNLQRNFKATLLHQHRKKQTRHQPQPKQKGGSTGSREEQQHTLDSSAAEQQPPACQNCSQTEKSQQFVSAPPNSRQEQKLMHVITPARPEGHHQQATST